MIKNSFKTIFEFPLMLLGFALPTVFIGTAYIPMFTALYGDMDYTIMVTMMVTWLFMFLFVLFFQFIYMPVLLNYIYEASQGAVQKGWFKRGLKRNWWKVFVGTLIASVPMYVVYFIFFIIIFVSMVFTMNESFAPIIIAGSIFTLFIIFWVGFLYTALVSITAEEKFDSGFKNIFKVGFKNILKVTLASFVSMLPAMITSGVFTWYYVSEISWGFDYSPIYFADMLNDPAFLVVVILATIVLTALNALGMSFIYVYTYKHYIKRRAEIMPIETPIPTQDDTTQD